MKTKILDAPNFPGSNEPSSKVTIVCSHCHTRAQYEDAHKAKWVAVLDAKPFTYLCPGCLGK